VDYLSITLLWNPAYVRLGNLSIIRFEYLPADSGLLIHYFLLILNRFGHPSNIIPVNHMITVSFNFVDFSIGPNVFSA
jgi:hypothetical protein